ncbi:MAG: T9SS type A sorting domain-containing protein [Calditrichaeota bacterium]|nr:T9SS type A sorting domain-containing protein [Calditrichota bacterium]
MFAREDLEQNISGGGRLRISDGIFSKIVHPIDLKATIFKFTYQFRAPHIYHIEWSNDFYRVMPEEIKSPTIYPNPSKGDFSFSMNSANGGVCSYEIYNILGVKVFFLKENLKSNEIVVKNFDLSHLPSGIYFLRIRQSTQTKSMKFVIVR